MMKKKKDRITKVTKVLYFPLFGGKPPLDRFYPKVAWWVMSMT